MENLSKNSIDLNKSNNKKSKNKRKQKKNKNSNNENSKLNSIDQEDVINKSLLDILGKDTSIILDRYAIMKLLGSGSFGEIHLAYDIKEKSLIAIKFELISTKSQQLKHEFIVIENINKSISTTENNIDDNINNNCINFQNKLQSEYITSNIHNYDLLNPIEGIPKVYTLETIDNKCNLMTMELLGPSLSDLFYFREKIFSLSTCILLGIQMITRIECIHDRGYIHRDIKPENFLMGLNEYSNTLYLIDYGLSKRYKEKATNNHIQYKENRNLIGTARYASINAHLGIEQSRRDDLESIGYLLVYFLLGRLPWQSKNEKGKDPNKIKDKKLITTPEILCKKLPIEFCYYFHYVKNLKYQDRPDYNSLRSLFYSLLIVRTKDINQINDSSLYNNEYCFDWFEEIDVDDSDEKNNTINNENDYKIKNDNSLKSLNNSNNNSIKEKNIEEKGKNITNIKYYCRDQYAK